MGFERVVRVVQRAWLRLGSELNHRRLDNELERGKQRTIAALVVAVLTSIHIVRNPGSSSLVTALPLCCVLFACLSAIYIKLLQEVPEKYVWAQVGFVLLDPAFCVFVMYAAPETFAVANTLVMVYVIRSGIRYGTNVLALSWGTAALTSAALLPTSAYWFSEQPMLVASYSLMLAVMPGLLWPIIHHLHDTRERLRVAATVDPLTGLGNRRSLQEKLRLETERAKMTKTMLAIVVIDLDNFKSVNDLLGHNVGDRLLRGVAREMRKRCRATDYLARTGGDEFVLLVAGLNTVDGSAQAHRIAKSMAEGVEAAVKVTCPQVGVTASAGINCVSPHEMREMDPWDLIDVADRAMYSAKRSGKSRVVVATGC